MDIAKEQSMTSRRARFDLERALIDPAAAFAEPRNVLADRNLSRDTKLRLLQQWERDARELAVAEDEGMTGGEESMLGRVRHALRQLGAQDYTDPPQTTRHGT
jgi:hypothetical protein